MGYFDSTWSTISITIISTHDETLVTDKAMIAFIAYLRVSTDKQGKSGLGLEAQQDAVSRFLRPGDTLVATFVEVESGRECQRPQLAAAIEKCRTLRAKLLIAKLDRLARDVAFIATLMKSDVKFIACDMPDADPFRLHIEAAIAEEEARKISARTRAALEAAKARGVVLGGFRGRQLTDADRAKGNALKAVKARARASSLAPILDELRATGVVTLRALADGLNARGIVAPRGGAWQAAQVKRLVSILAA
jgi:DNA invertase Pin-like site-specific DNA recombinase